MPNWKVPGPDGFHGFWLKKFTSLTRKWYLDDRIQTGDVPNWRVEIRTVIKQKDARKEIPLGNYNRPIE